MYQLIYGWIYVRRIRYISLTKKLCFLQGFLAIIEENYMKIGIDMGGSHVAIGVVNKNGEL